MNPPSFSEEKLTAYALNELSPAERREVEAELTNNPELKAELDAIQLLAGQLREQLSLEAVDFEKSPNETHQSDPSDRSDTSHQKPEPEDEKIISFRRHPWFYVSGLLAAAACAALMFLPSLSLNLQSAKRTESAAMADKLDRQSNDDSGLVSTQTAGLSDATSTPADETPASEPLPMVAMDSVEADKDGAPGNVAVFSTPVEVQSYDLSTKGNLATDAVGTTLTETVSLPSSSLPARAPEESKAYGGSGSATHATQGSNRGGEFVMNAMKVPVSPAPSTAPAPTTSPVPGASTLKAAGDIPIVGRLFATASVASKESTSGSLRDSRRADDLRSLATKRSPVGGESYLPITDNAFLRVADQALSTFSIDVDTGSYTNLRRFLNQGQLPPPDAVRIEEMVNYFNYNYPQPKGEDPFSVNTEVAKAPWKDDHLLVRIGLQGKTVSAENRPVANLVFLIDVSGSMNEPNKLPLVIDSMKLLVQKLKPEDRVGIAVYAGNSGMVLPSTSVSHRSEILEALSSLQAGGSTNGAMGIQLAYDMAKAHYIEGGINRVILCTDGDFNVGVTNRDDLIKLIEEKAKSKVFLSVFGFGMGNLQDATLEQLANKGNGNYGYIDNPKEAKRVFVDQVGGTLQTIAKDVKIQVEFNPAVVSSYRLIGYENRMLAAKDFNDDKKDAGEIGAGHRVTALYEIIPVGVKDDATSIDPLKYQKPAPVEYAGDKSEIMNVKLRYKQPEGDTSKLLEHPVKNENILSFTTQKSGWFRSAPAVASDDFQFAAGVAAFGMILRDSPYMGEADFDLVLQLAGKGSADKQEDRTEFITLVKKARTMFNPDAKPVQHAY